MPRDLSLPLFWRVCLINGGVFFLGTIALAFLPVTVSAWPSTSEIVYLMLGLALIAVLNAALLRSVLHPLDRLARVMAQIDLRHPGLRLSATGPGPTRPIVRGFNAMIERLELERSTSTARAMQAQEAERQRISQELHDEVGQSLTAVLLGLRHVTGLAPEPLRDELDELRDTTRTSLDEVRRISQRLRPGVLTDLGLLSALTDLITDAGSHNGPHVRHQFPVSVPALPHETELVIYRVTQEALTNVVRHARARNVTVDLTLPGRKLALRIADDGMGLPDGVMGAGIQGMLERANMIGGMLTVRPIAARPNGDHSGVMGGTEVLLQLPLPDEASS